MNTETKTICEHCHAENRTGALICTSCYRLLTQNGRPPMVNATRHLQTKTLNKPSPEETTERNLTPPGTARLGPAVAVTVTIFGQTDKLHCTVRNRPAMLGRADPERNIHPEIDLNPYSGFDYGVSRCHALLRREGDRLMVQDLGSANGSWLNGNKLLPHSHFRIRSGDTLRLGRMVLRVTFV